MKGVIGVVDSVVGHFNIIVCKWDVVIVKSCFVHMFWKKRFM